MFVCAVMNNEPFECLIVDGVEIRLHQFPHVAHKLVALWGTAECLNYLEQLLANTDRGVRVGRVMGFDQHTINEFMRLIDEHPKQNDLRQKPTYPDLKWYPTDHTPFT